MILPIMLIVEPPWTPAAPPPGTTWAALPCLGGFGLAAIDGRIARLLRAAE